MMAPSRRAPVLAWVLGALLATAAWPARPPDPFYLGLMRDGREALARGRYQPAAETLRLACFGLLDEPPLLAECLVRLGLAQAGAGERGAFEETFTRLSEVEERFGGYVAAALSAEERVAYEDRAIEWLSPLLLAPLPAFAAALERKQVGDMARLSPKERVAALERLATQQPGDPRWRLQLADLDLAADRAAKALERLQGLAADGAAGRVGCVRAEALAMLERCAEAETTFLACPAANLELRFARARLGCLVAAKRWAEANQLRPSLPAGVAADPEIRRLLGRVDQGLAKDRAEAATAETAAGEKAATEKAATDKAAAKKTAAEKAAVQKATAQKTADKAASEKAAADRLAAEKAAAQKAAAEKAAAEKAAGERAASQRAAAEKAAAERTAAGRPSAGTKPAATPQPARAPESAAAPAAPPSTAPAPVRTPVQAALPAQDQALLDQAQAILRVARQAQEIERALDLARPVADRHPDSRSAQQLVGALAYRGSKWAIAAEYLARGGEPGHGQPELQFYLAVALYETGRREGAAAALRQILDDLQRTPYVEAYIRKILGP